MQSKAFTMSIRILALMTMSVLLSVTSPTASQAGRAEYEQAVEMRAQALEVLGASSGDAPLQRFVDEHASDAFRSSMQEAEWLELLRRFRTIAAGAGAVDIRVVQGGFAFGFHGAVDAKVNVELETEAPYRILAVRIEELREEAEPTMSLSWGTLEAQLDEAAAAGFSGVVLVLRDGKPVLHRGYGLADREHVVPNSTETIFGIGSVPIDFTKAAVLLLEQQGKLARTDPITKFIPDVPQDKRDITIDHLMTGASGLPNFHHLPGVDDDYDLTYIDRDEAVRRMMAKQLLFAPGEGNAHSHSAWGLLAAIVEIVSGKTYEDFLATHFFAPAGMTRTGYYGQKAPFAERDFAVGYGSKSHGKINAPLYWGPTSWLVKGSGGMVSTTGDMYKWTKFIASGKVLNEAAQERYWVQGVLAGGSDRGFLFTYSQGFDSGFFLSSNAHAEDGDLASRISRSLADLVMGH